MGRQYTEPFRQMITDLDPDSLLAFIDAAGVSATYRQHIARELTELGVRSVSSADAANLIVRGYVTRDSDGAVGLAIYSETFGQIELFADGYWPSAVAVA